MALRHNFSIESVKGSEYISRDAWEKTCPANHPFLNADFFPILERHGSAGNQWGWDPCHLIAQSDQDAVIGLLPLYLKTNAYGDFIGDWSWANAYRQLGKPYFPRLLTGLPHTLATGPRLLVCADADKKTVWQSLIDAAKQQVAEQNLSSWHVGFPQDDEIAFLEEQGLLISHDVQFHWRDAGYGDFDGYIEQFSSSRRRKVRAERKRVKESGLQIEVRHGDEIDPAEWPALHALYAHTFAKFDNHAVFTAACFADLAAALGRRMVLFIARDKNEPVAMSLCFRSQSTLYGRYWGSCVEVDCLHFELCFYQGIAYCLREGLTCFEPGAGGEHKIARGFSPTIVRALHWIADPQMRAMIERHLVMQRKGVAEYLNEAALHLPFRNDESPLPSARVVGKLPPP